MLSDVNLHYLTLCRRLQSSSSSSFYLFWTKQHSTWQQCKRTWPTRLNER